MKRNLRYIGILFLAAILSGCGRASEGAPAETPTETLAIVTETQTSELSTASDALVETTVPQTTTLPETTEATTETTEAPTESEPTDRPPQLLHRSNQWGYVVTVELGDHRDLEEIVSFGDDHDPNPTMTWEGSFNPDEPGEYPITVTLSDSEGNVADYDVTVYVPWEKMTANGSFDLLLSQNPGKSCGIDVSKWQGDIDFAKVKAAGADFVLMRIGYGDVGGEMDAYFTQNFEGSKAAGLQRGVYFYSSATSVDAARKQADWIADALNGEPLDLPVAYDWENFKHFQDFGMSFDTLNEIYAAFADRMAEHGYDTMLYAEPQTLGTAWTTADKTIWLAEYGVSPDYDGDYFLRQVGNTGRIDGIDGDVDLNVLS